VTGSLPIPRLTGVFAAMENMTLGALSMSERPFHSAKPNAAGVLTSYGRMLGQNRGAGPYFHHTKPGALPFSRSL
jgi:hypothetical protein